MKKWDIFLVALIFLSLIALFYSHVLFFDELFIKRDIGRYYYPLRKLVRQQFESGTFPFWNPYLFCGLPLFATLQNCALYPVSIITYLGDFSRMFNIFILLHIFLAGIFMYILMKDLGLSKLASFFSAFTFAFSGYMLSTINLTISLTSAAWFPLLVYFYRRAISPHPFPFPFPFTSFRVRVRVRAGSNPLPRGERELSRSFPRGEREYMDATSPSPRRGEGRGEGVILSALTLLIMLLAGDPAIVYISLLILFCMSLYLFLEDLIERKTFSLHRFRPFFIIITLFLLLSAFQTLPFLEFLNLTGRKKMQWWVASGWSVPTTDLLSLAIPFFNDINWYFGDYWQVQSWLDNYYIGLIALFLCFIGAFFARSRKAGLLVLFSVFSLALALGKYSAFYPLLYKALPFFKFIRYPVRFFFLFTFCMAALAGIGLDYFRSNISSDERLRRLGRALLVLSFFAVVGLLVVASFSGTVFVKLWNTVLPMLRDNDPAKNVGDLYLYVFSGFYNFKRALALFAVFGLLFFLGTKRRIASGSICLIFVGISLCDVLATNPKYEATMDIKSYAEPTENIKFLQKDKTLFRIAVSPQIGRLHIRLPEKAYAEGTQASKDRLVSNRMAEYGIYDIGGYDSVYLSRQNRLLGVISGFKKPNESRLLDMLNVKYVCTDKLGPKKVGYRLVNKTRTAYLFENMNWLPRAYLAERAVVIADEDKIVERLKGKAFDPEEEVILEEEPIRHCESLTRSVKGEAISKKEIASSVLTSLMSTPPRNDEVQFVSYKPNEVIIKATNASPKFLILADSYYPGWKVFVDGKEDKIYRANYILRAVYLKEPGEHIVRFVYDPFSFKLGALISLVGIAAMLSLRAPKGRSNPFRDCFGHFVPSQ